MSPSTRGTFPVVLAAAFALFSLTGAAPKTESWDAVYIAGNQVGHIQTWIEPVSDKGRDLLRVRVKSELTFKRLKDTVTMKLEYGSIETPDGQVLRLDNLINASTQVLHVHGDVIDKKMNLVIEGGGRRRRSSSTGPTTSAAPMPSSRASPISP